MADLADDTAAPPAEENGYGREESMTHEEEEEKPAASAADPNDNKNASFTKESFSSNGHNNNNNNSHNQDNDPVWGSPSLRPVFLGNLHNNFDPEDVAQLFEQPPMDHTPPVRVERVDLKRGYCFVFLKPVNTQSEKEAAERFVSRINGMKIARVSEALRAEFARGDGRVKRKEDERRKNIAPSDTLFVVNFNEGTTKREDLQLLFEPFGELLRIDMKRNYAFVQFQTIEQATQAKERINGGKLDQSVLTVEYVARPRVDDLRRDGRDNRRREPNRRYDDRPPRGRYEGRGGGGRDQRYDRRPSPPRRRSSRSRSRSPPGYRYNDRRSRSPPRGRYNDDHGSGGRGPESGGGGGYHWDNRRGSPPPPDDYHRDQRGYRS